MKSLLLFICVSALALFLCSDVRAAKSDLTCHERSLQSLLKRLQTVQYPTAEQLQLQQKVKHQLQVESEFRKRRTAVQPAPDSFNTFDGECAECTENGS